MKLFEFPERKDWSSICQRPYRSNEEVKVQVKSLVDQVKKDNDRALYELTKQIDGIKLSSLWVDVREVLKKSDIDPELKEALQLAKSSISRFHKEQLIVEPPVETMPGVTCWRKSVPIERIGIYVPGGSATLFSSLLMLAIPAQIARVNQIIVCSPPNQSGFIDPVLAYAANLLGIHRIYTIGGAQAIAAMAYGTETIPRVDKIVGPGNQYVTVAKQIVQADSVAIDMPAGPSELLVIADQSAPPHFVAADLLSQAEHGEDSQVVLVSDHHETIKQVLRKLDLQLADIPRKKIAAKSLEHSRAVLCNDLAEAIQFSNAYAPEHLILAVSNYSELMKQIKNAGSVFLGYYSCESAGDYASGTNHTLPTGGWARSYSGVSVDTFIKKITFQEISPQGLSKIGSTVEHLAEAENLFAHKNAITIRLSKLGGENEY